MYSSFLKLCLTVFVPYVTAQQTIVNISFKNEKLLHAASKLNDTQLLKVASMTNITHMDEALDNICVVRVVGTPQHKKVKNYLKSSMQDLGWDVESDIFSDKPPHFETLQFENIIAKLNPNARRYLTLACHYDSKYTREGDFVGATDSAVPCAQLLNLATVMKEQLDSAKTNNVSLMFIFFDGEEAFHQWGKNDSIYGAKHLAKKWHNQTSTYGTETEISELDKMDMLMLLDLLGARDPTFYSYFSRTEQWYKELMQAERDLARLNEFQGYSNESGGLKYFINYHVDSGVEDDHIPFLERDVPILHLIPSSFPSVWHTPGDNRSIIDMETTENLNKILRVFVASYLHLKLE